MWVALLLGCWFSFVAVNGYHFLMNLYVIRELASRWKKKNKKEKTEKIKQVKIGKNVKQK